MHVLHDIFAVAGCVLLIAALPLLLELLVLSLAAILPSEQGAAVDAGSFRLAVVVPAHNEEKLVAACVASLRTSEYAAKVYVVAHNCSDATAERAAAAGAEVLVLNESSGHGKGAALDYGFGRALEDGAEGVLVVDSDSVVGANLTRSTAAALRAGAAATQCRYVVADAASSNRARLMALALLGMNVLRPRGRWRLGLSCGIFGNGFALSAETLRRAPYVAHSIVEDLEYHLLLVRAGMRVEFLDHAQVFGEMPANKAAAATQRARWEGGRILMRQRFTLPLLREVVRGRLRFLEPLLDLRALPLGNTAMLLLVALVLPMWWVRALALFGMGILVLYVVSAAWLGENPGQDLKALVFAPFYLAFKVAQIPSTRRAARKDAAWVRTERNDSDMP